MRWLPLLFALQVCCTVALPESVEPSEVTFSAPGLTWTLPITVATVGYTDSTAVSVGMTAWNQWLGVSVFDGAKPGEMPDVTVIAVASKDQVFSGYTDVQIVAGKPRATVKMFAGYHDRGDIIAHELGHVLGLAHDVRRPWSVMDGSPSWLLPVLTRSDCQALAMKYRLTRPPCLEPYGG